jgi:hypothetical protein
MVAQNKISLASPQINQSTGVSNAKDTATVVERKYIFTQSSFTYFFRKMHGFPCAER